MITQSYDGYERVVCGRVIDQRVDPIDEQMGASQKTKGFFFVCVIIKRPFGGIDQVIRVNINVILL